MYKSIAETFTAKVVGQKHGKYFTKSTASDERFCSKECLRAYYWQLLQGTVILNCIQ